jgi:phenylpropionate dioxygenase-like ring-hydroxylating dioxygenase large terminal subunit
MFEGFAHVWTPVAMARELRANAPLAVKVAGTPVVLFRGADGSPVALVDRCPHRGVALSLGKVKDGCIECPFHGWRLDASGDVCHVPWNPDAKLGTLHGIRVPVRELANQLWIYTAPGEAPSEPQVHEALLRPDVRVSGFAVEWRTHWTRAMENMLDWPHLPFVHAKTIGRSMIDKSAARMDVTWEDRPWGAHTHITIDGEPQKGSLDLRWPNQMNLHISPPGKLMVMVVACVPVDAERTRMLLVMARDFMTSPLFDPFFHWANARIATEDKAIVESSQPPEVPPASEERSVRTDAPTLAFRKRYYAELRGSSASETPAKGSASPKRVLPLAG